MINQKMTNLSFVTGNIGKFNEVKAVLGDSVEQVDLDLDEIQAIDLEKIAIHKAKQAYQILKTPVLVEDTALMITAWNDLPGALIKWFLKSVGIEGICQMMSSFENKDATAVTTFVYYDGTTLEIFAGQVKGKITEQPRGDNGFGWDKIFEPSEQTDLLPKTFAEMTLSQKGQVSMRGRALVKLKKWLEN